MTIAMPASSAADAAELLDQLIAQGLAPSNQDLGKIRQLIVILFQACILQPLSDQEDITPQGLRRARDTLKILSRHSSLDLLNATDDPLYQFLLPRLIHAASNTTDMYEDLIQAGGAIVKAMGKPFLVQALRKFAEGEFLINVANQAPPCTATT